MNFYILIFPQDIQYIVFGELLRVFLRLFPVSCMHCYRKKLHPFIVKSYLLQVLDTLLQRNIPFEMKANVIKLDLAKGQKRV